MAGSGKPPPDWSYGLPSVDTDEGLVSDSGFVNQDFVGWVYTVHHLNAVEDLKRVPSPDRRDWHIVERLRSSPGSVSGELLASELGMSRAALWKRVESLKAWGYGIEATRKGYTIGVDDGLAGWEFDAPGPVVLYPNVGSTMDEARALAEGGAQSGAAVLALAQSAGRGRSGGSWESPAGGLYLSFVVRSPLPPSHAGALSLEATSATLTALEAAGAAGVGFRWPNDIIAYVCGEAPRKAGGVLVEAYGDIAAADFYVVGVGLNVPPGLLAAGIRRADLAAAIVSAVVSWSASPNLDPARWLRLVPPAGTCLSVTLWNEEIRAFEPSGFNERGDLVSAGSGRVLSIGECRIVVPEGVPA